MGTEKRDPRGKEVNPDLDDFNKTGPDAWKTSTYGSPENEKWLEPAPPDRSELFEPLVTEVHSGRTSVVPHEDNADKPS